MAELSAVEHAGLVRAFSELDRPLDVLIIDTAAGIADSVITFSQASQEVIVVVTGDPTSLTDAYALIKVLNRDHGVERVQVLANMVRDAGEAQSVYEKPAPGRRAFPRYHLELHRRHFRTMTG